MTYQAFSHDHLRAFSVALVLVVGLSIGALVATDAYAEETAPTETAATESGASTDSMASAASTANDTATVATGDATSGATVVDNDNINDTTIDGAASTTVETGNVIIIRSAIDSNAESGNNSAEGSYGADIFSGAANAYALIASFFNVVITNSFGKLLMFLNPIDGVLDLGTQFDEIFGQGGAPATTCTLTDCTEAPDDEHAQYRFLTGNEAEIHEDLTVVATSGANTASSTGTSTIHSGKASAAGAIINIGNLQIINSRYLMILFNKFGSLRGDIVLPQASFFDRLSFMPTIAGENSITTSNTAEVELHATVDSTSGGNTTVGSTTSTIETGDANSGADIRNDINHTSLGGRPICFIVSVGGQWNGSVIGLPEWFSREETPFGEVICGTGRSEAVNTRAEIRNLTASSTNHVKLLINALVKAESGGNSATGTVAKIKSGDATSFLSVFNFLNQSIIGQDWILGLFTVSGDWTGDLTFGSKEFWKSIDTQVMLARGGGSALRLDASQLSVAKTSNKPIITASTSVDYTVVIKNTGGPVYNALLVDTIYNPDGVPMHEQRWGLGTIAAREEITITYTTEFNASTTPGIYTNEAFVFGIDRHPDAENNLGNKITSPTGSSAVLVRTQEEVDEAPKICMPLLTTYIRRGTANDAGEVRALQNFLLTVEKNSTIAVTGEYDDATFEAVRAFQSKYAGDILTPWGVTRTTGFVYYTTQKKINEIWCDTAFPLVQEQVNEIEAFRNRVQDYEEQDIPLPTTEYEEIGMAPATTENRIAVETTEAPIADTQASNQVAAVGQAFSDETTRNVWSALKERVSGIFSWMGF